MIHPSHTRIMMSARGTDVGSRAVTPDDDEHDWMEEPCSRTTELSQATARKNLTKNELNVILDRREVQIECQE